MEGRKMFLVSIDVPNFYKYEMQDFRFKTFDEIKRLLKHSVFSSQDFDEKDATIDDNGDVMFMHKLSDESFALKRKTMIAYLKRIDELETPDDVCNFVDDYLIETRKYLEEFTGKKIIEHKKVPRKDVGLFSTKKYAEVFSKNYKNSTIKEVTYSKLHKMLEERKGA